MTNPSNTQNDTTTITITLPPDHLDEHATLSIRCGDIDHHATLTGDTFADICRALHTGLKTVISLPPAPDTPQTTPAEPATSEPDHSADNTAVTGDSDTDAPSTGKPPYRLHTSDGKHRRMTMLDPFELQERYHKTHKRYIFNDLDEILNVARTLIDAGKENELHVRSSDGQTVQIMTVSEPDPPFDDIDTPAREAMYDIIGDEARTLAVYEAIHAIRKHGWKTNLAKQRQVKGAIFTQLSDTQQLDPETERIIDVLYQVALDSSEFDTKSTS